MTHDELRSLVEIKKDDLLNLCSDIIRIPSVNPPGDTDEMVQFICDYLKSHNIEYEIASGDGKTKNILARLGKKGGRVLILNGHCDVVPVGNLDRWDFDPFCGDIKDGKILGRGTSDMKGGLTGLLFAMGLLADNNIDLNGEVLLTVVPDEEAFGQGGTKWLVESETVTGDACLIAEPTGYYNCEIGQKGTCSIKLMAHGTPAHGSLAPFIGDNAICKLLAVLNKVDCIRDIVPVMDDGTARVMEQSRELAKRLIKAHGAQQVLNHCTVNIGKISGGTKVNMVPDYAEAEIDVRLPLGVSCDMVEERLIRILHEVGLEGITYTLAWKSEPNSTPENAEIVNLIAQGVEEVWGEKLSRTYQWASSDARIFRYAGIPTIQYGPANLEGIHAYNETVDVQDVVNATKIYVCAIVDYLNAK